MGYRQSIGKNIVQKWLINGDTKDREYFTGRWIALKSQVIPDG